MAAPSPASATPDPAGDAIDAAPPPSAAAEDSIAAPKSIDPTWAWTPYEPSPAQPWKPSLAAHLYRRAAFGATASQLGLAVERGPRVTIDDLLQVPAGLAEFSAAQDSYEVSAARSGNSQSFEGWWLRRLVESPWPLLEKLTLFWHNHFAIGAAKCGDLPLFQRHVRLLRDGALGNYRALLGKLLEDPAMYAALGGDQNRRAQPNLSFARPWIQLFTVGPGTAREQDIAGVARAFTGWFVYNGRLRFLAREHDDGTWDILGKHGQFGRDELRNALVDHPSTTFNLAQKLFRWFISEAAAPDEALLRPLAESLRRSGTMREPLEMIFRSNLFFSSQAVGQKIKSPVDLAVGLARCLRDIPPGQALARDVGNLGQRLAEPPTMHGWPSGPDWINTVTLAGRVRLSRDLLNGTGAYKSGSDPWRVACDHGCETATEAAKFWLDLLVADPLSPASARPILEASGKAEASPAALRRILGGILTLPEFQLN